MAKGGQPYQKSTGLKEEPVAATLAELISPRRDAPALLAIRFVRPFSCRRHIVAGPPFSGLPTALQWRMPELTRPKKITFAEMRAAGVRWLLVYCSDYKCSH
jgi:hypothetical protein